MNNELVQTGLKELASMIATEVKRASSNSDSLKSSCFPSVITFKEAFDLEIYRRKSRGHSNATLNAFKSNSKRFITFLLSIRKDNLAEVTVEDIEDYLISLRQDNLTGSTINKHISCIRSLFKTLVQKEMLEKDPTRFVTLDVVVRRKQRVLTLDEIKEVMLSFDLKRLTHFIGLTIFTLQSDIGCRVSELVNMRVENINLKDLEVTYYASKNKVEVTTPISSITALILKVYIKNLLKEKRVGYLFIKTDKNGKVVTREKLSTGQIRRIYREAGERAGLDFILSTHTIRRTKITQHLMHGGDLASAQELVGHKDIRSTSTYVNFTKKDLRKKHKEFGIYNLIMRGEE